MLISYERFIEKVENAESVRVIGSFNIEYTEDIMNIINAVVLLEKLGKCSNLCNSDWYIVDCINKEYVELNNYLTDNYFALWVNDRDYEIWEKNDYYAIATVDEVTVIKVK